MHTYLSLKIAYDGTEFYGWQDNGQGRTVESELRSVLELITQGKVSLQAASRTDRGVHALGQVVSAELENEPRNLPLLFKSLNSLLPEDIAVLEIKEVTNNFHPTLNAKAKTYDYLLCNGAILMPQKRRQAWHFPHLLDLEKMRRSSEKLVGTHDFKGFCNYRNDLRYSTTTRTLTKIEILSLDESILKITITGDSFLYKMVRNLVGTLAYIGAGKLPPDIIDQIFTEKKRALGGMTAPAHGLYLKNLLY